jgi:hypothetical protein
VSGTSDSGSLGVGAPQGVLSPVSRDRSALERVVHHSNPPACTTRRASGHRAVTRATRRARAVKAATSSMRGASRYVIDMEYFAEPEGSNRRSVHFGCPGISGDPGLPRATTGCGESGPATKTAEDAAFAALQPLHLACHAAPLDVVHTALKALLSP